MNDRITYRGESHGVILIVSAEYLDGQSDPEQARFVWAYHVRIENHGDQAVQLIYRHWMIADSMGGSHAVVGDGVVGEKPILKPGDFYTYSSGTPLGTPSGFMSGRFNMIRADGLRFNTEVPAFSLDQPGGDVVH
ncbi:MAG: Co2+/Mg2+ efflux protein ApaG [Rhodospirillaceae bacterium TMED8]|nr:Co2+/Mg2+ efflux protein ApaG [Magnetovibrio sp.]OUT53219.1 MAG: Co2+/Mg2+ efflux protein ApaG [Rhodospirillaceae bacterium TMED8]|tara:strand:+ start:3127 stop:3531 length:405 start_codon:yes stop_codon:yes gene_type:complete